MQHNEWEKHGVVLASDQNWESKFIANFPSSVEIIENGKWRFWYFLNGPDKPFNICKAEGDLRTPMLKTQAKLSSNEPADCELAIGNLPKNWHPTQAIHIKLLNGKFRLYFWVHSDEDAVVRFLVAESDNARQYSVLNAYNPCLYHHNDRAALKTWCNSIPGLTPNVKRIKQKPAWEASAPEHLICNDATTVYQLEDGTFELYSAALVQVDESDPRYIKHDNAAGWVRVIDRWESQDGLSWTNRKRVIERDSKDPLDLQFYHLAVTHTSNGRIGMLGRYSCDSQVMDIEWCWSSDGINWERNKRSPWIPRSDVGNDSAMIFPPSSLIYAEDKWWLFYTGYNVGHNLKPLNDLEVEASSAIMLATIENIDDFSK
jgi:hypothetical protein